MVCRARASIGSFAIAGFLAARGSGNLGWTITEAADLRRPANKARRRNAAFRPLAWRPSGVHGGVHGECMVGWRDACLIAALAAGFAAKCGGAPARADDQALTPPGQSAAATR